MQNVKPPIRRMPAAVARTAPALALPLLAALTALPLPAQEAPIEDNSFLIEEAYNQEAGVVQHVSTLAWSEAGSEWAGSFTQEWPLGGQRHQASYTLSYLRLGDGEGWGDVALHYRYQWRGMGDDPVALAPRVSLLLPTGDAGDGLGAGAAGVQVNLPVSARLGREWVGHWNVGGTYVPDAEARSGAAADIAAFQVGQGLVWLLRPRLNLMLEASWASAREVTDTGATERVETFLVSPGVRAAIDLPSGLQIVPGLAVPIGVGPSDGEWSVFAYLSFEHPF